METFRNIQFDSDRIAITGHSCMHMLNYEDIVYIMTDRPYIIIVTKNKKKHYLLQSSIKQIISMLPYFFCICNQSTIINTNYLIGYQKIENEFRIQLIIGAEFKVSRRYKNLLRNINNMNLL